MLFGITVIAFVLTRVVPGDPAVAALGQHATPEQLDNFAGARVGQPSRSSTPNTWRTAARRPRGVAADPQPGHHGPAYSCRRPSNSRLLSVVIASVSASASACWPRSTATAARLLLRVVSLGGISVPASGWRWWRCTYVLQVVVAPRRRPPRLGRSPPPDVTGIYTSTRCSPGHWPTFRNAAAAPDPPGARAGRLQHGPAHPLHSSGGARRPRQRLRPTARAKGLPERPSSSPRPARGAPRSSRCSG